ncbi:MAG TPA: ATP-binding protein, partial [Elusimicrobiales bacterium]|nr:ATP-binding protein [Elusimicrobiales bacterium]
MKKIVSGIVFKFAFACSAIAVVVVAAAIFFSADHLFLNYMEKAAQLNDPYPMVRAGVVTLGPAEKDFLKGLDLTLVLISVLALLVAFVNSFAIAWYLMGPIKNLSSAAVEIAKGNLQHRASVVGKGEFSLLADVFNFMARELAKAQELRKQFFADAAHELKTPIAVLKGHLEGMLDGIVPMNKETVASLLEETECLNKMIGDIKYLALADSGQLVLNRGRVDLDDLVAACVGRLKSAAEIRNLEFAIENRKGSLAAKVDSERFAQVLYNLLLNGTNYTPPGGRIGVITDRVAVDGAEKLKITVWDTGPGIPLAEIDYVFERFYRADKSRDRNTGGFGLGLAIAKKIVE